jgi:GTPase
MFIDQVKFHAISGKGGNGMMHFRQEKFRPRGGPDGGDGGRGGSVLLKVAEHQSTLRAFQHQKTYKADDGRKGGTNDKTGAKGENLVLLVPPGTVVYDDENNQVIADLVDIGQEIIICKGGRGGRGNPRFAHASNKAPRIAEKGEPFEEIDIRLELKLIADVGIVGVPNSGKSTLLSVVSNAKPKIGAYPFTTIQPNLGVALLDEYSDIVLADLPGLIEGAHMGIGLGHEFLRHVQRTRVLIHLLDGMSDDPVADYSQINTELALFDEDLGTKPQVVALTKADLPEVQERWPEIEKQLLAHDVKPYLISSIAHQNIKPILFQASKLLAELPVVKLASAKTPVYSVETDPREFTVHQDEDGDWIIQGKSIERAAAMTYWEYDQSVVRFQKIMEALGIDEELRKQGIVVGELVIIGENELKWED